MQRILRQDAECIYTAYRWEPLSIQYDIRWVAQSIPLRVPYECPAVPDGCRSSSLAVTHLISFQFIESTGSTQELCNRDGAKNLRLLKRKCNGQLSSICTWQRLGKHAEIFGMCRRNPTLSSLAGTVHMPNVKLQCGMNLEECRKPSFVLASLCIPISGNM